MSSSQFSYTRDQLKALSRIVAGLKGDGVRPC